MNDDDLPEDLTHPRATARERVSMIANLAVGVVLMVVCLGMLIGYLIGGQW